MLNKGTRRIPLFSFLLIGSLFVNGLVVSASDNDSKMATDKKIIKEVLFSSEEKNDKKENVFEQTIKENGKTYKLQKVEYEIVDESPVKVKKDVTKIVKSDPIPEGQEYTPSETLEEDGITYKLVSVNEKENSGQTSSQTVNGYTDYDRAVSASDIPATKQVVATNRFTGESMSVTCNLQNIETIADSTWEDTYIDIVFESYDSNIFSWNGLTVTKDTETPLSGYESQLLASVGADASNYRVIRTYWTGNPYQDANGVICRNARADVQRKITRYRAYYSADVPVKTDGGKIYEASYQGTDTITDQDQFVYTIRATATYELQNFMTYIFAGIGILLLISLIVLILFLIWKRKEKREEH